MGICGIYRAFFSLRERVFELVVILKMAEQKWFGTARKLSQYSQPKWALKQQMRQTQSQVPANLMVYNGLYVRLFF